MRILSPKNSLFYKNVIWNSLNLFFSTGLAFLIGAYVAKYLGSENYGKIRYSLTMMAMVSVLAKLGYHRVLTRELIKHPELKNKLLGGTFVCQMVTSVLLYLGLFITFKLGEGSSYSKNHDIILFFSIIILIENFLVINSYFESLHLNQLVSISSIVYQVSFAILRILFIYLSKNLYWFIGSQVICSVINALVIIIFAIKNNCSPFKWKYNFKYGIDLLKDCWPDIFSGLVQVSLVGADIWMIGYFMDDASAGIYSVSVILITFVMSIPNQLITFIWPVMVKKNENSYDEYVDVCHTVNQFFTLLGYASFICVFLMSETVINLLFNDDYIRSILIIKILSIRVLLANLNSVFLKHLLVKNLLNLAFRISVVRVLLNIVLNYVFIPLYGIIGVAIATVISDVIFTSVTLFIKETREMRIISLKTLINPVSKLNQMYKLIKEIR